MGSVEDENPRCRVARLRWRCSPSAVITWLSFSASPAENLREHAAQEGPATKAVSDATRSPRRFATLVARGQGWRVGTSTSAIPPGSMGVLSSRPAVGRPPAERTWPARRRHCWMKSPSGRGHRFGTRSLRYSSLRGVTNENQQRLRWLRPVGPFWSMKRLQFPVASFQKEGGPTEEFPVAGCQSPESCELESGNWVLVTGH